VLQEDSLSGSLVSARRRLIASSSRGAVLATIALLAGCSQSEPIRHYQAPKLASVSSTPSNTQAHAPLNANAAQRMLAAIIPHSGQAWYLKVTGTPEAIEEHAAAFRELLKSIRFEQGQPQWQLPDGWTQQPASGMRFATLLLGQGDKALELSVIPLPTSEGDQTENTLANVNRWRAQLGLPAITAEQLPDSTETFELEGTTATMVDLVSQPGPASAATAMPPATSDAGPPDVSATSSGGGIKFKAPDGWQPAPLVVSRGGITLRHDAAFAVSADGKQAEFTLDRLPPSVGLLQNVNRWRGQIGLEPITDDQLSAALARLDIDGVAADMVELVGARETILGIMALQNGQAWYFKLKGDKDLVEREKENFRSFAESVQFP